MKRKISCVEKESLLNLVEKMKEDGYIVIKNIWRHFNLFRLRKEYSVELFMSYKDLDVYLLKHGITEEIINEAMRQGLSSKEVIKRYYKKN